MSAPPPFFSAEFHLRFLPAVIRGRLAPEGGGTTFVAAGALAMMVGFAICATLLLAGLPGAVGPATDWISVTMALAGAAGLVALVAWSIASQWGVAPSYEAFHVGAFAFCVALGGSAGLWAAILGAADRYLATQMVGGHWLINAAATAAGLVGGYLAGVPAGLWLQRLGPFGSLLGVLAWPGVIGLVATDLVLLSG